MRDYFLYVRTSPIDRKNSLSFRAPARNLLWGGPDETLLRIHPVEVYILSSKLRVLYTGVTSNLERRVHRHKSKPTPGFTARYNISRLVYFEETNEVHAAIGREKQIKSWRRSKKISLIESMNPEW